MKHKFAKKALASVLVCAIAIAGIPGAAQIFPSLESLGVNVFAKGGPAKADITLYPMHSIWKQKKQTDVPAAIGSVCKPEHSIPIGGSIDLTAYLIPAEASQKLVWDVEDPDIVSLEAGASGAHITALKKGSTKVSVCSGEDKALKKQFSIRVLENNFQTNIGPFVNNGGNWLIDGEVLSVSNSGRNDYYMTGQKLAKEEYVLRTELKYQKGNVNLFFASKGTDPADGNAYAVQFGNTDSIRLFRFAGDTVKEEPMGKNICDGEYHQVEIVKTKDSVTISVDGKQCLSHTFDSTESFYNDAYAGIGLWDGELSVKGFSMQDV